MYKHSQSLIDYVNTDDCAMKRTSVCNSAVLSDHFVTLFKLDLT